MNPKYIFLCLRHVNLAEKKKETSLTVCRIPKESVFHVYTSYTERIRVFVYAILPSQDSKKNVMLSYPEGVVVGYFCILSAFSCIFMFKVSRLHRKGLC